MSELAHLPRGLLSLEQWDALELDRTRRWELSEGTLIISPRPHPRDQRISKKLIRLDGGNYRRIAALDGDKVHVNEPAEMEFALDMLTGSAR